MGDCEVSFFVLLVSLQIHSLGLRAPAVWQTCGVFHIIIFLPQILHFGFECTDNNSVGQDFDYTFYK